MGEAIELGMRMLEARKAQYRSAGTDYYRPWLFLITDGEPTDMAPGDEIWNRVTGTLQQGLREQRFAFFAGMAFRELFFWLSCSQRQVSVSQAGSDAAPPLPAPGGWADSW